MTGSGPKQGFQGPGHAPFRDVGAGHVGMFSLKFITLSTYSCPFPDYYPLVTSKKIKIEIHTLAMGKQAQSKEGQDHTEEIWQKGPKPSPRSLLLTTCLASHFHPSPAAPKSRPWRETAT